MLELFRTLEIFSFHFGALGPAAVNGTEITIRVPHQVRHDRALPHLHTRFARYRDGHLELGWVGQCMYSRRFGTGDQGCGKSRREEVNPPLMRAVIGGVTPDAFPPDCLHASVCPRRWHRRASTDGAPELAICLGEGSLPTDERDKLLLRLKGRGEDGYLMCCSGKRLVLTGNSPRATLYAVYHFLEKYLGCGWCVPGDDIIPKQATIRLPVFQDAIGPPAFAMRKILQIHDQDADFAIAQAYGDDLMQKCILPRIDWMAKNRFNWAHPAANAPYVWERNKSREVFVPEVEKRGLYMQVGGHAFNTWLPPDRYAKDHPDYWTGGYVCLSHPDVARLMAENINKWLDENPEADAVDLWHNDGGGFCHCPKCTPVRSGADAGEAEAAYARTYIEFVNRVAALVAPRHPKVLLNFLAYSHVTDCPAHAEPLADNVLVGFCLFPRPTQRTMRPLETSPQELDRNLRRQIPGWQKLSKNFYIYEYYTLSNWHEAWKTVKFWSMVSMIREDIGFFRRIGVDGLSSDLWEADWCPLNMYAFGKLTWNPELTTDEIIADFCRRYYGKASDSMIAYWNLLEEGLRESWNTDAPVNWRDQQRAVLIEKALSQVADDARARYRIHTIKALHRSYWPE